MQAKGFFIGGPDDDYNRRVSNLVAKKLLFAGLNLGYYRMNLSKENYPAHLTVGTDPWLLRVNVTTIEEYRTISALGYSPHLVFHVRDTYWVTGSEFHSIYEDRLMSFIGSIEQVAILVADAILTAIAA